MTAFVSAERGEAFNTIFSNTAIILRCGPFTSYRNHFAQAMAGNALVC
jgi:hypothetical protein